MRYVPSERPHPSADTIKRTQVLNDPIHPVIAGYGCTALARRWTRSGTDLAAEAVLLACEDAGIGRKALDGLVIARSPILSGFEFPLDLHRDLGLRQLTLLTAIDASGTSMLQAIQVASMAIRMRVASHIACVFADTPIRGSKGSQSSFSQPPDIAGVTGVEAQAGLLGAIGAFGLMTRTYMARHGVSEQTMAQYVIAARRWAALSPEAMVRSELSWADYQASPYVVDPIRLVECALPVNGAFAVIVSDASLAPRPQQNVYVRGVAQGHDLDLPPSGMVEGRCEAPAGAAARLFAEAGIQPSDVECFQTYDPFPIMGLRALEDFGFCEPGEAADFVARGQTSIGGKLPMNTGGGHLAGFYLQGATPLFEALVQLRHQGGARQVVSNGPVLVTGMGGKYVHHTAALLDRRPPKSTSAGGK